MSRPLILSASRRTDLPGFYPEECRVRIIRKIEGLRTRYLYGVVFWTRHVKPFLEGGILHNLVTRDLDNSLVNFTLTGLGGSRLEPGVPTTDEILSELPGLIEAFHGEPWRIRWRFDPLLKEFSSIKTFEKIAIRMSELKILTCTFSFPAYFSLKGDLTANFESAKIPKWHHSEKAEFLEEMVKIAQPLGIKLFTCTQPENTAFSEQIEKSQCISKEVLEKGHPQHKMLDLPKDFSQRAKCLCIQSEDIGDYDTDKCRGGCVYCYSKAGGL